MGAQQTEPTPPDDQQGGERDPTLPAGSVFGAYTIVRCVGRGGMGAVYEAKHRELGKRVALKALHRRIADDPRARARFVTEGRAASRLRHPHVVDVSDHGILHGVPYLVMEFLGGETLAEVIARDGALSVPRTAEVMLPVCAAVTATHLEGIVHRDLKPANIFLSRDGLGREQVKVLDFGVSKVDSLDVDGLTATGALLGTPWYMSPEQAQDPRSAQAASDQYALGVILSECVTGRRAFDGKSLYIVLRNIVSGTMVTPRAVRPEIPEDFEAVVLRAASVDISARYASVDDLARALLPFASTSSRSSWGPIFHADPGPPEAPSPSVPPVVTASPATPDPDSLQPVARSSPPSRRARLDADLARIREHLGQLQITGGVAGAQVLVDGAVVATLPMASSVPAPVGAVRVELRLAGYYVVRRDVTIAAGQVAREEMQMQPEPAATPVAPPVVPAPATAPAVMVPPVVVERPPRAAPPLAPTAWRTVAWTTTVTASELAVGTVAALVVRQVRFDAFQGEDRCFVDSASGLPTGGADCVSAHDDVGVASTVAVVSGVAAGAVYAWVRASSGASRERTSALTRAPAPGGVGCTLRF